MVASGLTRDEFAATVLANSSFFPDELGAVRTFDVGFWGLDVEADAVLVVALVENRFAHKKEVQSFYKSKYCWNESPAENYIQYTGDSFAKVEAVDS